MSIGYLCKTPPLIAAGFGEGCRHGGFIHQPSIYHALSGSSEYRAAPFVTRQKEQCRPNERLPVGELNHVVFDLHFPLLSVLY
ncbi:hypothetical protein [Sinorhizobium sojae]|uniref:hypothetical protein n=1 Tax=Sinorhizobium sojae TaxID=716925 RepID=UPI0012F8CAAB|nr:hypothetical protein [Sinorhizobium sojae]